jgi:hypothetical protein
MKSVISMRMINFAWPAISDLGLGLGKWLRSRCNCRFGWFSRYKAKRQSMSACTQAVSWKDSREFVNSRMHIRYSTSKLRCDHRLPCFSRFRASWQCLDTRMVVTSDSLDPPSDSWMERCSWRFCTHLDNLSMERSQRVVYFSWC